MENQVIDVVRQRYSKEGVNGKDSLKFQISEAKLDDLKYRLKELGKEANAAMSSVEIQQQKRTTYHLLVMLFGEPGTRGSSTPSMVVAVKKWQKDEPEKSRFLFKLKGL